jgi:YD repeat-containing protein
MRHLGLGLGTLILLGAAYVYLGSDGEAADPMQTARADVKAIERAAQKYCIKRGEYPARLDALVGDGEITATNLRDPWQHEYQYDPVGRKNKGERPDIWTVTPAKKVIGNWAKDGQ